MGDSIRLRAGKREGMPRLSDRETAYVRDEAALYIGTPEGNVKLAAAGTEGRVTALETLAAAQGETLLSHAGRLTSHDEALDTHSELLEGMEGVQQTHGDMLESHEKKQSAHAAALTSVEERLSGQGETLDALSAAIEQLRREKLTAVPAAAPEALAADADTAAVVAAYNALLAALETAGIMGKEG